MQPKYLGKDEILINGFYVLNKSKQLDKSKKVFLGRILNTNEQIVIKLGKKYHNSLDKEIQIYTCLKGMKNIPKIYCYGSEGNFKYLILELLGPSLHSIFKNSNNHFSLECILKLSVEILSILKEIHSRGIILRYIKPHNIIIGKNENRNKLYFIDFEYAKKYIKYGKHIKDTPPKRIIGNINFISINAQNGGKVSRKDDIESLAYNIIYFMKGKLPWNKKSDFKYEIKREKDNIKIDALCLGLPEEIKLFVKYAREMKFEQEPDYSYLNGLLLKIAEKNNINIEEVKYDWVKDKIFKGYSQLIEKFYENAKAKIGLDNTFIGSKYKSKNTSDYAKYFNNNLENIKKNNNEDKIGNNHEGKMKNCNQIIYLKIKAFINKIIKKKELLIILIFLEIIKNYI